MHEDSEENYCDHGTSWMEDIYLPKVISQGFSRLRSADQK